MKRTRLRTQLTLLHVTAIVVILALAAVIGRWSLSNSVHDQLDAALLALAETEAATLSFAPNEPVRVHEVAPGPSPPSFVRLDRLVQIVDANGAVVARSRNLGDALLPAPAALLARLEHGETVFDTLPEFGEEPTRMVSIPALRNGAMYGVQVAGSLDDVNHVVASATWLFVALTIALLATLGATGAFLTRRAFSAIDDVVRQARHIDDGNLSERLPHPGTDDEIGALVETLNEMLTRIEQSFETQRHFTADASHELRSPLSRLRAEIEVTLRRPREAKEYVDTLRSCLSEVERLTQLMEELLLLARLDANQERNLADVLLLNPVVAEAIGRARATAQARDVEVSFDATRPVTARVGRGHLGLVLDNLIGNAVKFSPSLGRVSVELRAVGDEAVIDVTDDGPGIDREELPRLFERFYRGRVARVREAPGAGLGLALSQSIVRANGGTIEASCNGDRGARFTVRFPLSPAAA